MRVHEAELAHCRAPTYEATDIVTCGCAGCWDAEVARGNGGFRVIVATRGCCRDVVAARGSTGYYRDAEAARGHEGEGPASSSTSTNGKQEDASRPVGSKEEVGLVGSDTTLVKSSIKERSVGA